MASKEGSSSTNSGSISGLTTRDIEQLVLAVCYCNKEEMKIDYVKFAQLCKYKNANSSKAGWHGLKKKIEKLAASHTNGQTDAMSETGTPSPKKRKAGTEDQDGEAGDGNGVNDDRDMEESSPKKRAVSKAKAGKVSTSAKAEQESD